MRFTIHQGENMDFLTHPQRTGRCVGKTNNYDEAISIAKQHDLPTGVAVIYDHEDNVIFGSDHPDLDLNR